MATDGGPRLSNAYELFILLLTVLSLAIMAVLVLPKLSPATATLLEVYDNVICVIFLFDFGLRMRRTSSKRGYFFAGRGWLDLLGSIPSFGFFKYTALLRLARLSRLSRIIRLLRDQNKREVFRDVIDKRGQYAVFITVIIGLLMLSVSGALVLQFESHSPNANITTGGEALWWSVVTLTTVGYGDYYPVTPGGRITAVVVMFVGVGIIASLASIFTSVLIPTSKTASPPPEGSPGTEELARELAEIRRELTAIRTNLGDGGSAGP